MKIKNGLIIVIMLLLILQIFIPLSIGNKNEILSKQTAKFNKNCPSNEIIVIAPNSTFFTTNSYKSYVSYRENLSFKVTSISLEPLGNIDADKIRNLLKSSFLDGKRRYLLILGDEYLVPLKYCYNDPRYSWIKVYSDYYYADLEGDWDKDEDDKFGEFKEDEVDFIDPEFLVGRLPGKTPQEIDHILNRTIKFDKNTGKWKSNVLLAGGTISVPGDSNIVTTLIDRYFTFPKFNVTIIADDWILFMKPDIVLNKTSFGDTWKNGAFGLVYVVSHGSETGLFYNSPSGMVEFYEINEVLSLNPNYPSVFVSIACQSNTQYTGKTLGKELILFHSVAAIGATVPTHPGKYFISGAWAEIYFIREYLNKAKDLGNAIRITRAKYFNRFVALNNDIYWGKILQTNLIAFLIYGDPLVKNF